MNDHTVRIMTRMIRLMEQYKEGSINIKILVDGLEGSINAIEEKLPEKFYSIWDKHWVEIYLIYDVIIEYDKQELSNENKELVINHIEALKALLTSSEGE